MTLAEYVSVERGRLARIHRDSGVALSTLNYCVNYNQPLERVSTARAVSAATEGAVSVAELLGLSAAEARVGAE